MVLQYGLLSASFGEDGKLALQCSSIKLTVHRVSLLPAMVGLALFSVGTALSKNAATIMVTRFFSGVFGAAPVSNVAAVSHLCSANNQKNSALTVQGSRRYLDRQSARNCYESIRNMRRRRAYSIPSGWWRSYSVRFVAMD